MKIEVVLTETEIVQELVEAVESRDLPEKLFYWGPLPVRTWMALTGDPAFDGARRCWKQLAGRAAWLTEAFKGAIPLISLGAGDGATDRLLLDAIRACGREQMYFPVDASQSLLEIACAGAEDLDIDTSGIKADIASPMHLVFASDAAESPKLILMSGNTLGGFDPMVQVRHVAECVHAGDRLVLDAEIFQDNQDAHVDESMRQLAFAPLAGLGLSLEDGEVRLEQKRDDTMEGLHVTTTYFRPDRDLRIAVLGRDVLVERGEHIHLKFWYRFSAQALRSLLGRHGGLKILEEIPSPDGRYLLAVCARG
jgi:uncharacterized SAM-dependent methyltransferase